VTADELIAKLMIAYPRSKTPRETLTLYREKLAALTSEQRDRALDSALAKSKFMPSLAELLAWAVGREPGKAKAKRETQGWDRDTLIFMKREEAAQKRNDRREMDFLIRVRRAWHAAKWRSKHGGLHGSDEKRPGNCVGGVVRGWTNEEFNEELRYLGMNLDGSTINGRPHGELAVPDGKEALL
jgi:hypothetical protein